MEIFQMFIENGNNNHLLNVDNIRKTRNSSIQFINRAITVISHNSEEGNGEKIFLLNIKQ